MPQTKRPFKTILFGFAFSPSLNVNLIEANRVAHFFNARLILLHVGEKSKKKEEQINSLLKKTDFPEQPMDIHWRSGNPYIIILEACSKMGIDLLILGASQQENLYRFYVGSIARKLTRKVCCSVLLLIKPSVDRIPCKHIVVNGLKDEDTPLAIDSSFYLAKTLGAKQVTIVEEIMQKEIHVTVEDDRSLKRATINKERLKTREDQRIKEILKSIPKIFTENVNVKTQSIFGKRGYSIGHYAKVVRADLLVMNAPKKTGLLDRIFPHDIEYILSDLPTDLLIVRKNK